MTVDGSRIRRLLIALTLVTLGMASNPYGPSIRAQDADAAGESATSPNSDERLIRQILDAQVHSWNSGDLDGFMAGYWRSPRLTFSAGGQITRGWQATLDRYRQRYPDRSVMGELRFGNIEFFTLVLGTWHLTNNQGNPEGNFSLVLQKLDGNWRIVHDHSSTLEPEEPEP